MCALAKKSFIKSTTILGSSYLFILLYLYAAVSKLLDFETFTIQLAQSPLLSAYASIISWLVPGIEIAIAILLMFPRFRTIALYAAFILMVMFTAYIYIILNFSDFIPCSCGGVLEKLSWTQHLFFNIFFIILAGVAVFFAGRYSSKKTLLLLVTLSIIGIGIVALLFVFSEKKMHRNNAFVRRYPHHPIVPKDTLDLSYNSYYFAGRGNNAIYFGNFTAPLHVLSLSATTVDTISLRIDLPKNEIKYKYPRLRILDSLFYLFDGTVPIIHIGNLKKWKVIKTYHPLAYFTFAEPISANSMVIRSVSSLNGNNVLGIIELDSIPKVTMHPDVLTGNLDGYFDRDGQLIYNERLHKIIYVYYYKNKYVSALPDFSNVQLLKTIDTISLPQIDVKELEAAKEIHIGGMSTLVNRLSSSYGNYLFINSDRLGRFESEQILKEASIIDVYNIREKTYQFSFYLYHHNTEKLRSFNVYGNMLYALIGNKLYTFKIKEAFLNLEE
jgi:uncharacterized membrane protein YphA (DoxX/SURF4 family)